MKASMILSLGVAAAVSAHSNDTLTTSTVLATSTYTVLSCAPTVTNCPVGHVTTEVVVDYTTVCPVTATQTTPPPFPTSSPAGVVSTVYSTEVITISKCAASVTNCPYTTAPITTVHSFPVPSETPSGPVVSSVPVPASQPAGPISSPPSSPASSPAGPVLSTITISTCIPTQITSVITVTPSPSAPVVPASSPAGVVPVSSPAGVVPSSTPSGVIIPPPSNTTIPFTGGASAQKAGGLLMAVGIVAALL